MPRVLAVAEGPRGLRRIAGRLLDQQQAVSQVAMDLISQGCVLETTPTDESIHVQVSFVSRVSVTSANCAGVMTGTVATVSY